VSRKVLLTIILFHTVIIGLSNYLITLPVKVLGFSMTWAAFSFPLIVVATDLTIRMIGKREARKIINIAFIPAIIISIIVIFLTGNPANTAFRIGIASGCSYLASNLLDVYVFQKVRERFNQWWAAPTGSSILANLLDTYTFFTVAFYGSSNVFMRNHWLSVAFNQASTKIIVSWLVILPIYGILLKYISKRVKRDITGKVLV
jgi:queuosine precursor transporter